MSDKIEYEVIDNTSAIVNNFISLEAFYDSLKVGCSYLIDGNVEYPALCMVDTTANPCIVRLINASHIFNAMRKNVKSLSRILEGASDMIAEQVTIIPPLNYNPSNGVALDIDLSAAEWRATGEVWHYNPWTGIPRTENAVKQDPFGHGIKYRSVS